MRKKGIVLVSGGLDSATTLAIAKNQGFECYALSFRYGQRHASELKAAEKVAMALGAKAHRIIPIAIGELGGSALTDNRIEVPHYKKATDSIPVTYVPARNTIFLSIALAWAEIISAHAIFIGSSEVDYSGYPDCREDYFKAFETLATLATKVGVEDNTRFKIHRPLVNLSKAQTILAGTELGVDYSITVSCYAADDEGRACGDCESCHFRRMGFDEAGIADPTRYV